MHALTKKIAAAAALGALAIPAAAVVPALADDGSTTTPPTTSVMAPTTGAAATSSAPARRAKRLAAFEARLAEHLGLSTDTVSHAVDASRVDLLSERLDKAVTRGRITRARADQILAAARAGNFPTRGSLRRGN